MDLKKPQQESETNLSLPTQALSPMPDNSFVAHRLGKWIFHILPLLFPYWSHYPGN